jgi:hypothetical protein
MCVVLCQKLKLYKMFLSGVLKQMSDDIGDDVCSILVCSVLVIIQWTGEMKLDAFYAGQKSCICK